MLNDFADAADIGAAGNRIGVNNTEAEIGLEESVHHNPVAELEDL